MLFFKEKSNRITFFISFILFPIILILNRLRGELDYPSFAIHIASNLFIPSIFFFDSSVLRFFYRGVYKGMQELISKEYLENRGINIDDIKIMDDKISIRIYHKQYTRIEEKIPVVIWLHGGGWTLGDIESDDKICYQIIQETHFIVASIEYRLSPENPFPIPLNDSINGIKWVINSLPYYNGDISNVFLLGESAGGNIAASIAMMNNDKSYTSQENMLPIAGLGLIYPPLDAFASSHSYSTYQHTGLLSRKLMISFWKSYMGTFDNRSDYRLSPLYAPETLLKKFPPTFIVLAKNDVLFDECFDFYQRLREESLSVVDIIIFNTTIHGFFGRNLYPRGPEALKHLVNKIRQVLN